MIPLPISSGEATERSLLVMPTTHLIFALCFGIRFAAGPPPAPPEVDAAGTPEIEFRIDPLVDLVFLARSIDPKDDPPAADISPEIRAAADAAAALDRAFGNPLAWGLLSDMLISAGSAAGFAEACAALPEEVNTGRGALRFRAEAIAFAQALTAAEPAFLAERWPGRREAIEAAQASLEASFAAAHEPWMPFVLQHLAMKDPQDTVPVYLVGDGPWPGAVTHRWGEGGVCFVAINAAAGSQLVETVIHESIHALDVSTSAEPTALTLLRQRLAEAGIAPADPRMRDVPHALIFVHAAETTRRCIDPDHVDYGETEGVYQRLNPGADIVRSAWRRYLEGELKLEPALDEIVAAVPARDRPEGPGRSL